MTELRTAEDVEPYLKQQMTTVQIVTIHPEAATALLNANTVNRRLNEARVAGLVTLLKHDQWKLSNDAVVLDWDGRLSNGQHRLASAELSGKSIQVLLVSGSDPTVRDIIDTGQKRSLAGALHMRGETNQSKLSAVVTLHWKYVNELLRSGPYNRGAQRSAITQSILLEHLDNNPGLRTAVSQGESIHARLRMFRHSPAAVFWAVTSAIDPYEAAAFVTRISNGDGLESGDPELTLRNWFQRTIGDATSDYQLGIAIKAWNKRREGERLQVLSLRESETYPRAR